MNIIDFINEFKRLYNHTKKYDMELPTGVLAYRFFKSVGISSVKVEPVFKTRGYSGTNRQIDGYYRGNIGQNNSYCGSQGRGRFGRGEANQNVHGSGGSIKMR